MECISKPRQLAPTAPSKIPPPPRGAEDTQLAIEKKNRRVLLSPSQIIVQIRRKQAPPRGPISFYKYRVPGGGGGVRKTPRESMLIGVLAKD